MSTTPVSALINIHGQSQVEIVFSALSLFEATKSQMAKEVEPLVRKNIEDLNLQEKLAQVTTMEQLDKVEVDFMPTSVREALASQIDACDTLTDVQKAWCYTHFLFSFYEAAVHIVQKSFAKRAQELANSSRIIKP